MKYLGCAYYPEYWGIDRVPTDAKLMRQAGINIVRIGEFAWSRMEPEEGRFTLDWLHRACDIFAEHGIEVLMCTPTAAPPAWLTSAYPDVLQVKSNGERQTHGIRRHYCPSSDTYRRHAARITGVLSREMASHPNVVAWQIDNEFGDERGWCLCENCQAHFQAWLKARYVHIEELNRWWGTGFWSNDYNDWRQVRLSDGAAATFPSRKLDSRRFFSGMMVDFASQQADILRRNHPAALITTNGMGPIYAPINYYDLFGMLDVACDDLYFDIGTMDANALAMNNHRSLKPGKAYWITETGSGALSYDRPPHPDQMRAWLWSSWGHGADAHFIFRWRTCLSGQEQELQGILEHSGEPRHRYRAVQLMFNEMADLRSELANAPLPVAKIAIVQDYNVIWAYESARVGESVHYPQIIYRLHKELYRRNLLADFIPPERDLSPYRIVVLPSLVILHPALIDNLKRYVETGGIVLALGQIGMRDVNNNYWSEPAPYGLQELFGVKIFGGMYLRSFVEPDEALWWPASKSSSTNLPVAGALNGEKAHGQVETWAADMELCGATPLVTFTMDAYQGQPAIVEKANGSGKSIYVGGTELDDALYNQVLDYALESAGISHSRENPLHVEILQRGAWTVIINHTRESVDIPWESGGRAYIGSCENRQITLLPFGVCLIKGGVISE